MARKQLGVNPSNNADAASKAYVDSGSSTLTNKTIDADNNTLSNIEVDNFKASAIVTEAEGIASNDNDTTIPTSAAVKDYVDAAGGGTVFDDDVFAIQDEGDNTKQLRFQLSGITTSTTRTLTAPDADTTIVGHDTTQTLTNKTLTSPVIDEIRDVNGNVILATSEQASAVNYIEVRNWSTGGAPALIAAGTDPNIDLSLSTKGTGGLYHYLNSGAMARLTIDGDDPDIGFNIITKGTGVVQSNGINVVTVSGTQTLTNKTFDANGTGNVLSNVEVADFAASAIVTEGEGISGNDNDTTIPTSAAVKDYVDSAGGGSTFTDDTFTIQDEGDNTKQLQFQLSGITTSTTRTLTIPDADMTLVGTDTTQTVSNKTIDNSNDVRLSEDNFRIQDAGDSTKQIQLNVSSTQTTDTTRVHTFPIVDSWLVGRDTTDTLTNKTIDADNNTLSNIEVDNFKASAIVTEAEGIASNDNDTTIPTSAAVKDYVDAAGGGSTFTDDTFTIQDEGDNTKQLQFQLSNITTSTTRTLTIPDADTTLVGTDTAQTLTNKTLTAPRFADGGFIADANGNEVVELGTTTSAVNHINVVNAATGTMPAIYATGSDSNIGMWLQPKGTGNIWLGDGSGNTAFIAQSQASAVNYTYAQNAATGNSPEFGAWGSDTDVDLNLATKGSGAVKANGVDIVTISDSQTLTNKTIDADNNTITNIPSTAVVGVEELIQAGENLVLDPSFENDAMWANAWGTQSTDQARHGTKSRLLTATGAGPTTDRIVLTHTVDGSPLTFATGDDNRYLIYAQIRKHPSNVGGGNIYFRGRYIDTSSIEQQGISSTLSTATIPDNAWLRWWTHGEMPTDAVEFFATIEIDAAVPVGDRFYIDQVIVKDVTAVRMIENATQTLSNKTLDAPRIINNIKDSNGADLFGTWGVASAVNYLGAQNATTTNAPYIASWGADDDIDVAVVPKGEGYFKIHSEADNPVIIADGPAANQNLDLIPKGTGRVQENGKNLARSHAATIGDGSSTSIAVTHNLGTKDVTWSIRDASTDEFIDCDVTSTSTTQITFTFDTAPGTNAYRVVVVG